MSWSAVIRRSGFCIILAELRPFARIPTTPYLSTMRITFLFVTSAVRVNFFKRSSTATDSSRVIDVSLLLPLVAQQYLPLPEGRVHRPSAEVGSNEGEAHVQPDIGPFVRHVPANQHGQKLFVTELLLRVKREANRQVRLGHPQSSEVIHVDPPARPRPKLSTPRALLHLSGACFTAFPDLPELSAKVTVLRLSKGQDQVD